MAECIFQKFKACNNPNQTLSTSTHQRLATIIDASKVRDDNFHVEFQQKLNADPSITVHYHKNCVSSYTSKTHLIRLQKRSDQSRSTSPIPQTKRQRRSDVPLFDFKEHCLFCSEKCDIVTCAKNPSRYRRVLLCRTAERGCENTFKNVILDTCRKRADKWADDVRVRIEGAVSDLHAADARYHSDCKTKFMAPKSVQLASSRGKESDGFDNNEHAFERLVTIMKSERLVTRNSSEIYNIYQSFGGTMMSKRGLIIRLSKHFAEDLLILKATGFASILIFREKANDVFSMVAGDDDDMDSAIKKVTKKVKQETKLLPRSNDSYQVRMNNYVSKNCASQTMVNFLKTLLKETQKTLPILMICNMITGLLSNKPTPLQITLGVLMKGKELIHQLYTFGVVCSYDEVLRFRRSAAHASRSITNRGLLQTSEDGAGLVQVIVDNFDTTISSQNGLQSTHSLAILLTQTNDVRRNTELAETIRRISKEEMTNQVVDDIEVERYYGPKKPEMPQNKAKKSVLPLRVLTMQVISSHRAIVLDLQFLRKVTTDSDCSELNGFNSSLAREEGQAVKPQTSSVYEPMIDMVPSDPDTMLTALAQAEILTKRVGQDIVVFTCDQQLYKVAVNITWIYPERFANVILRLGGMHFIMSFIGCIGTLMAETGLADVMECCFGGVQGMLLGKKFPQNYRALRMVVEELLRNVVQEATHSGDLMTVLEARANETLG